MGMSHWLRRLSYLRHRDANAAELDEEMRLHLELRERSLRERGVAAEDAHFAARRQFGNRAEVEVAGFEVWGWGPWERLAQDVRYAARSLGKAPAFVAVAVLTLAVGLGMNTAVFSIVNGVMLRSLPYPAPDRLVSLWEETKPWDDPRIHNSSGNNLGTAGGRKRSTVAPANLADYRQGANGFEGLAGVAATQMNLTGSGSPERILGERVTANYFDVLGVKPEVGRTFTADEDREGGDLVVVLAHSFWQGRLGSDQAVLTRTLMLDAHTYHVIGVMPRWFQPVTQFGQTLAVEYWVPAAYSKELLASHGDHEVNVVGRLKPNVPLRLAQQQLDGVSAALAKRYPESNTGVVTGTAPLRDDLVKSVRESLWALLTASGLIVLITSVNVANLLMVRSAGRRHETSVRLAIGAGRGRIIRQCLIESLLLSGAGCLSGVVLGRVLLRALLAAAPPSIPRLDSVTMDWLVFAVAAAIACVTGILFGFAPAWQASRIRPAESLKSSERHAAGKAQSRWRGALTVTEVALSLILMVGAGLFLKSFATIMGVDLGFKTDRVLAMNITLPNLRYQTADQRLAFFQQLEERVRPLPGIQAVGFANRLPLRGGWGTGIQIEGIDGYADVDSQAVNPGYFDTLGIPLVRGRLLTAEDRKGQPDIAVVNLAFARQYLNGSDPIGRRIRRGAPPWFTIVGVVNDIRREGKTKDIRPQVYLSAAQTGGYPVRLADFAVRTAGDPHALFGAIQRQVWAIDKDQPITSVRTMDEIVSQSVEEQRFQMFLLLIFAAVAVILAMIGVFGVLSYSVNLRMNEIGIRMAIGASPWQILRLVLNQAGVLVAAGAVCGLAGAWGVTRFVSHLLFQVQPQDAVTYLTAAAVLLPVALAAALAPALRGARVDPVVALRYE